MYVGSMVNLCKHSSEKSNFIPKWNASKTVLNGKAYICSQGVPFSMQYASFDCKNANGSMQIKTFKFQASNILFLGKE